MGLKTNLRSAAAASTVALACIVAPSAASAAAVGSRTHVEQARQQHSRSAAAAAAPADDGTSLITPNTDANALAQAMNAQPGLVTGASWPDLDGAANPSSQYAVGVATGPGVGKLLPTDGNSFAVLTNGDVRLADPPNDNTGAGADNGTSWRGVNDPSQLEVDVNVPAGDNCLALDGAFYSEEYPEFVGSEYNDGFIAELDQSTWSYDPSTNQYSAPNNFAFDDQGHLITVNSVDFASDQTDTGLQYDGSTKLLTMSTPITAGAHKLFFSIFDAGDHIYDSAMFLDNLRTYASSNCAAGAAVADTDGDGIPDAWEDNGVTIDGHYINLPAMGASPTHKDVFVQVNAMDGLRPSNGAMRAIQAAFNNAPVDNPDSTTGIHLHIDNGPSSEMNPATGQTWGSLSEAADFPYQSMFGPADPQTGAFPWTTAFDPVKQATFTNTGREPIFHLAFAISQFDGSAGQYGHTGLSRSTDSVMASSDYMVSMGLLCQRNHTNVCPQGRVAGTFMHELGHNLGLHHGGQDNINYKPNYPSVMNYLFQYSLVPGPRGLDYSRIGTPDMPILDESNLDENVGIGAPLASPFANVFTYVPVCNYAGVMMSGPVDFNCDGNATETGVAANLNPEAGGGDDNSTDVMVPYDDWSNLTYKGGAIGGQGLDSLLPASTTVDEDPTSDQLQAVANAIAPPPSVTTGAASNVTATTATLAASGNPDGSDAQASFQYGTSSDYTQAADSDQVDIGSGSGLAPATVSLTGLAPSTTYHYRAVITTNTDQEFGADETFTTAPASTGITHIEPSPKPSWRIIGRPRLDTHGRLLVTLRCRAGARCAGRMTVGRWVKKHHGHKVRTIKTARVAVRAGHTRTVKVALRSRDALLLRHGTKTVVTATLSRQRPARFTGKVRVLTTHKKHHRK